MTIVFIIIAVFAGALGGATAAVILTSGATEDAFRAGYRAASGWIDDELKWGGDE